MQEDRMIEEIHNLANQVDELTKKLSYVDQINIANEEIIKLQRKTISHLKMIGDDRRVEINQLNEKRWQVRKLESDRPAYTESCRVDSTNIADGKYTEGAIADMDCGKPEWSNDPYGL
jgi:hypothetical protein